MAKTKLPLPEVGDTCHPFKRGGATLPEHIIQSPEEDAEFQDVYNWLLKQKQGEDDISEILKFSVDNAIKYVLDGARTWRFDLNDKTKVDSDERSSVGTKLQYHIIEDLGLAKSGPLDTIIEDVPVDIKGSVQKGTSPWMIPPECQCKLAILVQIDCENQIFQAYLMRMHSEFLNKGNNADSKVTARADAVKKYARSIVPWTTLPEEPLKKLTAEELEIVFDQPGGVKKKRPSGLRPRIAALFSLLPPGTIVPRGTITTVGAGLDDPLRRAREAKADLRKKGIIILVGKWKEERATASRLGVNISNNDWCAFPLSSFRRMNVEVPPERTSVN